MAEIVRTYGFFLLLVLGFYVVFHYLSPLFLPFMIAIALAVLIDPWVNVLERRTRLPRGIAVGVVLALFVVFVVIFLSFGVVHIAAEIQLLADDFPVFYRQMEQRLVQLSVTYAEWINRLPPAVQQQIRNRQEEWVASASAALDALAGWLQAQVLGGLPNFFAILLVTVIATFFFSRDRRAVKNFGLLLIPPAWRDPVERLASRLFDSFVGMANAMVILVILTAAATTIGLALLGSKYALLLGVTSGLLDVIPIIGPAVLFVPWIAYHLLFGDVVFGLLLLLLYGVVTGLRTILQAQIIGQHIGLHPLTTLISLYVGAKVLGPMGFIVGPLIAVIVKAMYETGMLRLTRV